MTDTSALPRTAFHYLYRDGGNWKTGGHIVLRGSLSEELETRLRAALEEGEYFIPRQLDVRELYPWMVGKWPASSEDHSYHSLVGLEPTEEPPTDRRTLSEFVADAEAVGLDGWESFDPMEHQARHLPEVIEAAERYDRKQRELYSQWVEEGFVGEEAARQTTEGVTRPDWREYARAAAEVGYFHPDVDWPAEAVDWRDLFEALLEHRPRVAARLLSVGPEICVERFGEEDVMQLLRHEDEVVRAEGQFAAARVLESPPEAGDLGSPVR